MATAIVVVVVVVEVVVDAIVVTVVVVAVVKSLVVGLWSHNKQRAVVVGTGECHKKLNLRRIEPLA